MSKPYHDPVAQLLSLGDPRQGGRRGPEWRDYLALGLTAELRSLPPERRDPERRKRIEDWLDAGHGCCVLREPAAAACVVDTWQHFAGERYDLIAWVVMPNHVHVLIRTYEGIAWCNTSTTTRFQHKH